MGILDTKSRDGTNKASSAKRISLQTDLASLAALKSSDVTGLVKFRDHNNIDHGPGKSRKKPRRGSESGMDDSDYDDDDNGPSSILHKAEEEGDKDVSPSLLSADDIRRQGELAEGVRQIKVSLLILVFTCYANIVLARSFRNTWALVYDIYNIMQDIMLTTHISTTS